MSSEHNVGFLRRLKGFFLKHMHRMITCKEFEEFVLDYLDDELPAAQRSVFELHMRLCRECREYLAAYRRAQEVGYSILNSDDEPLPDDVPEDLVKAILDARDH
ncbi:MAG: anti-sigma factor family protein [Woeseiaceae bacterium]